MAGEYSLEVSPAARRDLKRLPLEVQKDIAFRYLPLIQSEPYKVGKPLTGVLKGERAYHFGRKPEHRIVYFVEGNLITVTMGQGRASTSGLKGGSAKQGVQNCLKIGS